MSHIEKTRSSGSIRTVVARYPNIIKDSMSLIYCSADDDKDTDNDTTTARLRQVYYDTAEVE